MKHEFKGNPTLKCETCGKPYNEHQHCANELPFAGMIAVPTLEAAHLLQEACSLLHALAHMGEDLDDIAEDLSKEGGKEWVLVKTFKGCAKGIDKLLELAAEAMAKECTNPFQDEGVMEILKHNTPGNA